jgi:hypothetical protein
LKSLKHCGIYFEILLQSSPHHQPQAIEDADQTILLPDLDPEYTFNIVDYNLESG